MKLTHQNRFWRPSGAVVVASLALPTILVGCGSSAPPAPPVETRAANPANAGMSTRQKVTLLAGAAAMYYVYKKYQRDNAAKIQEANAAAPGGKVKFYRSKLGGYIYYRDPKTKQAIRVTPPMSEVQTQRVTGPEASQYSNFQGYNNSPTGETLDKYFPVQ